MVEVGKIKREFPKAEKHYDFNKYAAAFAISTLIFIIGLLIGGHFNNEKLSKIETLENEMKLDLMSMDLQDILLVENPCFSTSTVLQKKLEDVVSKLGYMEEQLGKKDSNVLELKKYYSLLEIKHYLLMKNTKEKCNSTYNLILFFYSNDDNALESEKQGYVLDNLREKYGLERMKTYSFDTNLNLDMITTLKSFYNVTTAPTVIINGEKLEGFRDKEEIEEVILK